MTRVEFVPFKTQDSKFISQYKTHPHLKIIADKNVADGCDVVDMKDVDLSVMGMPYDEYEEPQEVKTLEGVKAISIGVNTDGLYGVYFEIDEPITLKNLLVQYVGHPVTGDEYSKLSFNDRMTICTSFKIIKFVVEVD